jgi:hypothetical protein
MTAEQLASQAKEKERARRERARRKRGIRTKAVYLAELASRPKPWVAEGISQRTWQRRQKKKCRDCETKLSRHESEIIVSKQRTHPATTEREVDAKKGLQGSGATRRPVEQ